MLKFKDWIRTKKHQFERLPFSANTVGVVRRLKDGKLFEINQVVYVETVPKPAVIGAFDRDNIHVYLMTNVYGGESLDTVNEIKIKINLL